MSPPSANVAAGLLPPGGAFNPGQVPGMLYYWLSDDQTRVATTERSGSNPGGTLTISGVAPNVQVISSGRPNGTFGPSTTVPIEFYTNLFITITGQPTPANNGTFRISNANSFNGSSITWINAGGVSETFSGSWHIWGTCNQITERKANKVFSLYNEILPYQTHFKFAQHDVLPGKYVLRCSNPTSGSNVSRMVLDDATLAGNLNGQVNHTVGAYIYAPNGWGTLDFTIGFSHITESSVGDVSVGSFSKLYCLVDTAGPGPRNIVFSTSPANNDDMQSSIAAPTGGYQLVCWTYDYSTRTTEWFIDGVSSQSVTDSAGSTPSPSNLRYLSIGDRAQNTQVRPELFFRGMFVSTGKLSTTVQSQIKTWYATR